MENQSTVNLIVDDARLMLENFPVAPRSQDSAPRTGGPVADGIGAQLNCGATMARASSLLPEDSAISLGDAEVDLARSALKMTAQQYHLKPFAPLKLRRCVEIGMQRHRESGSARCGGEQVAVGNASQVKEHDNSVALIERLAAAAEMRDEETGGHIARTGIYAGIIARGLGLPEQYAQMISIAATVHDIGKIGIQHSILSKPAALTSQEYEIMKTHTVLGEQMLSGDSCPLLRMAASIALSHHERWDGSGYPYGLAGEQIPLAGRIVMLADQYDALRSNRVYKRSLDHATTCAIICRGDAVTRPEHFDPCLLRTFLEIAPQFARVCDDLEQHEFTTPVSTQDRTDSAGLTPFRAARQNCLPMPASSAHC